MFSKLIQKTVVCHFTCKTKKHIYSRLESKAIRRTTSFPVTPKSNSKVQTP